MKFLKNAFIAFFCPEKCSKKGCQREIEMQCPDCGILLCGDCYDNHYCPRYAMEETMSIYTRPGDMVKYCFHNGYPYDEEHCKKYLKFGNYYTVKRIDIHRSSSTVELEEVEGRFNTVMFSNL